MVIVKRLANQKTRRETGLDYVVGAINLQTPFGQKLIKEQKPFLPGQEEGLRQELSYIRKLLDIEKANENKTAVLLEAFMMMKDNTLTIERSENAVLSVVEIFELKSLLLLMDKVRNMAYEMAIPELFVPEDINGLLDILDPSGDRLNTFYIYDSFSEKLAKLRAEKKELERDVRREQKKKTKEIRDKYGLTLTPKFEITVSKSDSQSVKMINEISDLRKLEEDYMSVTFALVPDEAVEEILKRTDEIIADIEEEELEVREKLSKEIWKFQEVLLTNCRRIGRLDVTLAKAIYADRHDCVMPEIVEEHLLEYTEGRHLQVEEIVRKKGGQYCPISIALKDGVTCITGANMGGKTVSLKLTGMIAILAQYGYFVPAKSARVGLSNFMQILIGDSQSIERGLSSFGSEMEELKEIMDNSKERSLLLIDEIAKQVYDILNNL
ncbi:MAG: hypothetical protein PHS19_02045 [Eubacteriales bacterium]|nr:hypothetical protein [Eubacteriales bacterium]